MYDSVIRIAMNIVLDRREAMPRFVRKPHSCVVQEGNPGVFKCKVIAASPATISWYDSLSHYLTCYCKIICLLLI